MGYYKVMGGVCLSVRLSVRSFVCRLPQPNSRTERLQLKKSKIGRMEAYHTSTVTLKLLEVKRSKIKVTRPINAVTDNAHTQVGALQFS